MSFDYLPIRDDVDELLKEFGRPFLLRVASGGDVYDEVTGETTPGGDPTDVEVYGVVLAPTTEYTQSVGAGNVQARDMLIYLQANAEPRLENTIVIDGEGWQIVNVQKIQPALTALMFIVQVRP